MLQVLQGAADDSPELQVHTRTFTWQMQATPAGCPLLIK